MLVNVLLDRRLESIDPFWSAHPGSEAIPAFAPVSAYLWALTDETTSSFPIARLRGLTGSSLRPDGSTNWGLLKPWRADFLPIGLTGSIRAAVTGLLTVDR